jgi:glutathionylspermidine synthase
VRRVPSSPRVGWERLVERQGLVYHHWRDDGLLRQYWVEDACYEIDETDVVRLRRATSALHRMCLQVAQHVVDEGRWDDVGIGPDLAPHVARSWLRGDPSLYGRFDLVYDGTGEPLLLEYNADTPTCLLEASVVQWHWARAVRPEADQLNAVHDHLVAAWSVLAEQMNPGPLHLLHSGEDGYGEEWFTALYLQDAAAQAGIETRALRTDELVQDGGTLRDPEGAPVRNLYKLYPWEWLLEEEDARAPVLASLGQVLWVEPLWKLLVTGKGVLPLLWELFPEHPNLLPAYLDDPGPLTEFARKPLFGREGSNVRLVHAGGVEEHAGPYADQRAVYQAYAPLPTFGAGGHAVVGSWVVGHQPCGVGLRESSDRITDERQVFVPHVVV